MDACFPNAYDTISSCGQITWSRRGIGAGCASPSTIAAFWVAMRPSVFLALATPLPVPRDSLAWIRDRVAEGLSICPPALDVWFAKPECTPAVVRHDGRHRATLTRDLFGNAPIPVLLRLRGPGAAAPHCVLLMLARVGMKAQGSGLFVAGPLFGERTEEDAGRHRSGVPPPHAKAARIIATQCIAPVLTQGIRPMVGWTSSKPGAANTLDGAAGRIFHPGQRCCSVGSRPLMLHSHPPWLKRAWPTLNGRASQCRSGLPPSHLARWSNPAVEDQCTACVHRIGQVRPITVHIPLARLPGDRPSFDDTLHALLDRKRTLMLDTLTPIQATGAELASLPDDSIHAPDRA